MRNCLSSEQLFKAVERSLAIQEQRFGTATMYNSFMNTEMIDRYCVLTSEAETILKKAFDVLRLSMRGYHKILKVSRTIADLQGHESIEVPDIQEAIAYRSLDKHLGE